MGSDLYSRRFNNWLSRVGLVKGDPFALYEAEREMSSDEGKEPPLPGFFLDRPYLYWVLGDPDAPQASFLMAGRGCGKTATKEMVAYECRRGRFQGDVLVVDYTDFDPLLDMVGRDLSRIKSRHHVYAVLRFAVKVLAEGDALRRAARLGEFERQVLMSYFARFADPLTRLKASHTTHTQPAEFDWDELSPLEIMRTFALLTMAIGYRAVYVLVDRVDEAPETAEEPTAAADLLKPLVADQPLLEMRGMAFKFFLPLRVGKALRQVVNVRDDRVLWHTVTWDRKSLRRMIELRLSHYSDGMVSRMEDLCDTRAKRIAVDALIEASDGSPRTMLRLCNALLHYHVANSDSVLIDRSEITDAIRDFSHHLDKERGVKPAVPQAVAPASPPEKGIYLGSDGHVWVDGKRVENMSPLEFKLLSALYYNAGEVMTNDELIRAVWGEAAFDQDETNLRKLVSRLRARLEPEGGGSSRFIRNVRGRGYWLSRE